MKKSLKMLVAGTVIGCALTASVGAFGAAAQEVKTWSGLKTGISSEFEAGHKGYKASCEHWNNPLVTTSKYYGWYY